MSCKLTSRYFLSLLLVVVAIFRAVCGTGKMPVHYDLSSMPRSCTEAMGMLPAHNGIYYIFLPDLGLRPFRVYCMEDEQGEEPWTVIQRRLNGNPEFYRGWEEYKRGFGNLHENFWLGMDKISAITNDPANPHELWVSLTETDFADARYSHFVVGNEFERYTLKSLGNYSGSGGDSLVVSEYEGMPVLYVAEMMHDAWWFGILVISNLNGLYGSGIYWKTFHGENSSISTSLMAVRPTRK